LSRKGLLNSVTFHTIKIGAGDEETERKMPMKKMEEEEEYEREKHAFITAIHSGPEVRFFLTLEKK
jgi:hypothetical protein